MDNRGDATNLCERWSALRARLLSLEAVGQPLAEKSNERDGLPTSESLVAIDEVLLSEFLARGLEPSSEPNPYGAFLDQLIGEVNCLRIDLEGLEPANL